MSFKAEEFEARLEQLLSSYTTFIDARERRRVAIEHTKTVAALISASAPPVRRIRKGLKKAVEDASDALDSAGEGLIGYLTRNPVEVTFQQYLRGAKDCEGRIEVDGYEHTREGQGSALELLVMLGIIAVQSKSDYQAIAGGIFMVHLIPIRSMVNENVDLGFGTNRNVGKSVKLSIHRSTYGNDDDYSIFVEGLDKDRCVVHRGGIRPQLNGAVYVLAKLSNYLSVDHRRMLNVKYDFVTPTE